MGREHVKTLEHCFTYGPCSSNWVLYSNLLLQCCKELSVIPVTTWKLAPRSTNDPWCEMMGRQSNFKQFLFGFSWMPREESGWFFSFFFFFFFRPKYFSQPKMRSKVLYSIVPFSSPQQHILKMEIQLSVFPYFCQFGS